MKGGIQYGRLSITLTCLALYGVSLQAATLRVGRDGAAEFATVQEAVTAAADGDTIVISPGAYTGSGNCDIDLQGKSISIQSTNPLDPAVVEGTIIDCAGKPENPHRGFYVVGCADTTISGLTIANGLATAGGAIYCKDSTLMQVNCRIVNNAALSGAARNPDGGPGGGLYCEGSVVKIVRSLIQGNIAGDGADVSNGQGGAGGDGGGVCSIRSQIDVEASTITNNAAGSGGDGAPAGPGGDGGGIYGGSVTLTGSTVSQNAAGAGGRGGRGGGIFAEAAVIQKCVIEANRAGVGEADAAAGGAGGDGGGVYGDSLEISNCLVAGNRAGAAPHGNGGGLWCVSGAVRNCTIAGNTVFGKTAGADIKITASPEVGAGIFCTPETALVNSVLYGNTPTQIAGHDCANVAFCNIEGDECAGSESNVSREPRFVRSGYWARADQPDAAVEPLDPEAVWVQGNYHLQAQSPCLDAGDPLAAVSSSEKDLDGSPRLAAAAVDIGAYESQDLVPIYRFWSPVSGKHFYTIDEAERDMLIRDYSYFWTFEGIAYYVYTRSVDPELKAVYRFWSPPLVSHFYTIDEAERDMLIKDYPHIWTYEGPAFYAYPEGRQPAGTDPVYRFWSSTLGGHFYTIDEAERDTLINQYSYVWTLEGVAWYAHKDANGVEPTPEPGAFEFTGGSEEATCTFTLKAYVDGVEATIDNPRLTFVPEVAHMRMTADFDTMVATIQDLVMETKFTQHTTTIRGGAQGDVVIPMTLSGAVIFWAATPRGPYAIDPQSLTFPLSSNVLAGGNETFSLAGSVTVDGSKINTGLAVRATRFNEGQGVFDTSSLPELLDLRMAEPFQWSRSQHEDRLLQTTVRGHQLLLYVTSAQVRTTGVWHGKEIE